MILKSREVTFKIPTPQLLNVEDGYMRKVGTPGILGFLGDSLGMGTPSEDSGAAFWPF